MIDRYVVPAGERERETFDWGAIEWLDGAGVTDSDALTVGRVTIRAGRSNPTHRHPNCDEALYLLEGTLEHTLGEESTTLGPGDLIHVPAGEVHDASNPGEEDAVMLVTYDTGEREIELVE